MPHYRPACVLPLLLAIGIAGGAAVVHGATATPEERAEIRSVLLADQAKADSLRAQVERGKNLSDVTLGMFAMHLLNVMSTDDAALFRHVHRDDHSTQGYLEDIFRFHPVEEIAAIEAMAAGDRNIVSVQPMWQEWHKRNSEADEKTDQKIQELLTDKQRRG